MAQLLFYDSQRLWPQPPASSKLEARSDHSNNALLDFASNSSSACNASSRDSSVLNNTPFTLSSSTLLLYDNNRIAREGSRVSRLPSTATYSRDNNRQQAAVMESGSPKKRGLEYEGLSSEEELEGSDMMNIVCGSGRGGRSEKKARRLTIEQVRALEMAFKADNKLEAQRKEQLAANVGLESRQVAIWFQNRRARWKTKQMEIDYATLKADFQSLRVERDTLLQEKQLLQDQVGRLKMELPQAQHSPRVSPHPVERKLIEPSPSSFHTYINKSSTSTSTSNNNNNNMSQDEESLELHMNITSTQTDRNTTKYDDDVSEESAIVNNGESLDDESQPIAFMKSNDPSLILHLNDCDVAPNFSCMPFRYPNLKEDHGLNEETIYPFSLLEW